MCSALLLSFSGGMDSDDYEQIEWMVGDREKRPVELLQWSAVVLGSLLVIFTKDGEVTFHSLKA